MQGHLGCYRQGRDHPHLLHLPVPSPSSSPFHPPELTYLQLPHGILHNLCAFWSFHFRVSKELWRKRENDHTIMIRHEWDATTWTLTSTRLLENHPNLKETQKLQWTWWCKISKFYRLNILKCSWVFNCHWFWDHATVNCAVPLMVVRGRHRALRVAVQVFFTHTRAHTHTKGVLSTPISDLTKTDVSVLKAGKIKMEPVEDGSRQPRQPWTVFVRQQNLAQTQEPAVVYSDSPW